MTREKWSKMSPDERRIKVAKLCGWRDISSVVLQSPSGEDYATLAGRTPDGTFATRQAAPRIAYYLGAEAV